MHPLTLVLAVPLFCTFGVSLPYQDEGFTDGYGNGLDNALELPNGDSSFKWNPEFSDLLGGGGLQATLPLSTDSDTSSFSENLPGLGGVDFAAKPGNQPKAGSPNQQPSAPGRVQPQPATGNTPSQQPSPGTAPQQQDPAANADLPWTANQNFGQLPPELRLTPQYGFIGPYFACTLDGVAGNVDCNPGYQCARCNEAGLFVYYCSSQKFPGYNNKCPARQGAIDSTDPFAKKRQLFADIEIPPPPICQCDKASR